MQFLRPGVLFSPNCCKEEWGKKRCVSSETNSAGQNCKIENTLLGMVVIWFESPRDDATPGLFFVSLPISSCRRRAISDNRRE